jgi:hypothetical protein
MKKVKNYRDLLHLLLLSSVHGLPSAFPAVGDGFGQELKSGIDFTSIIEYN